VEEVVKDCAHRQHGRSGIDRSRDCIDRAHLATWGIRRLDHQYVDALGGNADGARESPDARTDHNHPVRSSAHVAIVDFSQKYVQLDLHYAVILT
jgi:hypothetical protein